MPSQEKGLLGGVCALRWGLAACQLQEEQGITSSHYCVTARTTGRCAHPRMMTLSCEEQGLLKVI